MMTGRSKLNLVNDGAAFMLAIILNIILVPGYGVLGASISFAAAIFLVNILGYIEVYVFTSTLFRQHLAILLPNILA